MTNKIDSVEYNAAPLPITLFSSKIIFKTTFIVAVDDIISDKTLAGCELTTFLFYTIALYTL